mgnify:CR=1 FL=1
MWSEINSKKKRLTNNQRVSKLENNSTWKPLEDWQVSYVPHGINPETFKPTEITSDDMTWYFATQQDQLIFTLAWGNDGI